MLPPLEPTWDNALSSETDTAYFKKLTSYVDALYQTTIVYPPQPLIFNAFTLCPLPNVRVVILGQDPYHGPDQAHGLAFSVPDTTPIPPSLRNIFKEIYSDTGATPPQSGNLTRWTQQGVLLLNSTLTVEAGQAASHQGKGWEQFTDAVIQKISDDQTHVVFLLWGTHAIRKHTLIDETKHLILTAPHPSPLSAYRGFFGCRHFSTANNYLRTHGHREIIW